MSSTNWIVEEFYFGNANYPSDATYRKNDEGVLQFRVERQVDLVRNDRHTDVDVDLNASNGSFLGMDEDDRIKKFFDKYSDVSFSVIVNPRNDVPSLHILGWYTVNTPEGLEQYEYDKKTAWKKPTQS